MVTVQVQVMYKMACYQQCKMHDEFKRLRRHGVSHAWGTLGEGQALLLVNGGGVHEMHLTVDFFFLLTF